MSANEGSGAAKCPHEEHAGASGAGRGIGRPPGAPPSMSETLMAIQKQLTMQTDRMKNLADKSDVKAISDKVEALRSTVNSNTSDILELRRIRADDKSQTDQRIADLEHKVQLLSESGVGNQTFNKSQFQRDRYNVCRRSLRL